ncbi:MAG: helix-turn-helix domain-containing protein [Actinomycetota bacterium]|nr:helix-turn-helix domain-containing protein [Actinomycetota bacterium]
MEITQIGEHRMDDERLTLSVEEAAHLLGISRALAYLLVRRGELPGLQLGRRVVVPKRALEELVTNGGWRVEG